MSTSDIDALYKDLISTEPWLSISGESEKRKLILEAVVEKIDDLSGEISFSLSANEMAVWLPSEIATRFNSIPPAPAYNESTRHFSLQDDALDSVDWAGTNNPLGVSVVPSVKNQGICGACWAFATVGATEASVYISQKQAPSSLSVQELVDCDVTNNMGCSGGNPVYAYDYIIQKGLLSWQAYPYSGSDESCMRTSSHAPSATINSYTALYPSENTLLKYVANGPVAIGICANDFEFMYYAGGVYDKSDCCTSLNHAMLVVGYGADDEYGDYWRVQNSWGTSWGEQGYMRIKRYSDNSIGLCGLASSATMPLEGRSVATIQDAALTSSHHFTFARYGWELVFSIVIFVLGVVFTTLIVVAVLCFLLPNHCDNCCKKKRVRMVGVAYSPRRCGSTRCFVRSFKV